MDATSIGLGLLLTSVFVNVFFALRSRFYRLKSKETLKYVVKKDPTPDVEPEFTEGDMVTIRVSNQDAQIIELTPRHKSEHLTPNEYHWCTIGYSYRVRFVNPEGKLDYITLNSFELESQGS